MVNSGSFLVCVLLLGSVLHSASARKRDPSLLKTDERVNFVPAMRYDNLSEAACFPPEEKGLYVAVPESIFNNGAVCNKTVRIQCAEPYRDLGGPWRVCKTNKVFTVRVIDRVLYDPLEALEDDLFHLSRHAFDVMAHPGWESIRLILHK